MTYLTRRVSRRTLLSVLLAVFVGASIWSAMATSYSSLFSSRVLTALSQSVFWSIVVPVAAGLVPERQRGRAIAVVLGGSSIASVVGVPLGTWVGQQVGWRWSYAGLGALGVLVLVAVAIWLRPGQAEGLAAEPGPRPDRLAYSRLVAITVLVTGGSFTFFTFVSPFLTDVVLLAPAALSGILLLRGLAGVLGVAISGPLTDRLPRASITVPIAVQVLALAGLFWWPHQIVLTVVLVAMTGATFTAFTTPLASRAIEVAPNRVDLATSGISTAVNIGITGGSLIGSTLASARGNDGVAATALVGAVLTAAGLGLTALHWHWEPSPPSTAGRERSAEPGAK